MLCLPEGSHEGHSFVINVSYPSENGDMRQIPQFLHGEFDGAGHNCCSAAGEPQFYIRSSRK